MTFIEKVVVGVGLVFLAAGSFYFIVHAVVLLYGR